VKVHKLKTWPEYFVGLLHGVKTFEVRKDDRHFAVGDELVLCEWIPETESFTGRQLRKRITYMMHGMGNVGVIGPARGVSLGYVVLALTDSSEEIERNVECAADGAESGVLGGKASELPFL